jgi:hypothetical protein
MISGQSVRSCRCWGSLPDRTEPGDGAAELFYARFMAVPGILASSLWQRHARPPDVGVTAWPFQNAGDLSGAKVLSWTEQLQLSSPAEVCGDASGVFANPAASGIRSTKSALYSSGATSHGLSEPCFLPCDARCDPVTVEINVATAPEHDDHFGHAGSRNVL